MKMRQTRAPRANWGWPRRVFRRRTANDSRRIPSARSTKPIVITTTKAYQNCPTRLKSAAITRESTSRTEAPSPPARSSPIRQPNSMPARSNSRYYSLPPALLVVYGFVKRLCPPKPEVSVQLDGAVVLGGHFEVGPLQTRLKEPGEGATNERLARGPARENREGRPRSGSRRSDPGRSRPGRPRRSPRRRQPARWPPAGIRACGGFRTSIAGIRRDRPGRGRCTHPPRRRSSGISPRSAVPPAIRPREPRQNGAAGHAPVIAPSRSISIRKRL